jgi:hypothetical protein
MTVQTLPNQQLKAYSYSATPVDAKIELCNQLHELFSVFIQEVADRIGVNVSKLIYHSVTLLKAVPDNKINITFKLIVDQLYGLSFYQDTYGLGLYNTSYTLPISADNFCINRQRILVYVKAQALVTMFTKLPSSISSYLYNNRIASLNLLDKYRAIQHILQQPDIQQKLSKITHLDLSHCNLKVMPSEIALLKNLVDLDLSHNNICYLDEAIGRLKKLQQFNASYNNLLELPEISYDLPCLLEVNLKNNSLSYLPNRFYNCTNLKYIGLAENSFEVFPVCLLGISELLHIDLDNNKLLLVPVNVLKLPKLRFLSVSDNPGILYENDFLQYFQRIKNTTTTNLHDQPGLCLYQIEKLKIKLLRKVYKEQLKPRKKRVVFITSTNDSTEAFLMNISSYVHWICHYSQYDVEAYFVFDLWGYRKSVSIIRSRSNKPIALLIISSHGNHATLHLGVSPEKRMTNNNMNSSDFDFVEERGTVIVCSCDSGNINSIAHKISELAKNRFVCGGNGITSYLQLLQNTEKKTDETYHFITLEQEMVNHNFYSNNFHLLASPLIEEKKEATTSFYWNGMVVLEALCKHYPNRAVNEYQVSLQFNSNYKSFLSPAPVCSFLPVTTHSGLKEE